MKIKDFLSHTKIAAPTFAKACDMNVTTLRSYMYNGRTPCLLNAYKIVIQSNYLIAIEDLIPTEISWKPQEKIKTMGKILVTSSKMKTHERRQFFRDIDNI